MGRTGEQVAWDDCLDKCGKPERRKKNSREILLNLLWKWGLWLPFHSYQIKIRAILLHLGLSLSVSGWYF